MKSWLAIILTSLIILGESLLGGDQYGLPRGGWSQSVLAIECDEQSLPKDDLGKLKEYQEKCEQNLDKNRGQQQTLNSAITVLNSKINLAQGQINQTQSQIDNLEKEINLLSTVLLDLNKSLDELSVTYAARVRESYKQRDLNPLRLFFSSDSFGQLITKLRYFNSVKTRDRLVLEELEKTRLNYDQQKLAKETKQQEVEELKTKLVGQKTALGGQKSQKQEFLEITKNDEKKFQDLLTEASRQYEAYQDAIAGKGAEEEIGKVEVGGNIASIIVGKSVCSTGTHLHFETYKKNGDSLSRSDPFTLLQPKSVTWNLDGWYGHDDPANITGSWGWPINDPVTVTQKYGLTAYARSGAYGYYDKGKTQPRPHTGVDIVSSNLNVKAVEAGTLYRGSIYVKYDCATNGYLRYVKVDHEDGNRTYYFHVNYL